MWNGRAAYPPRPEALFHTLSYDQQMQIVESGAAFVRPDGSLDMAKLMDAFQVFWREGGHLAA